MGRKTVPHQYNVQGSQKRNSRQEPQGRKWGRGHRGYSLALLPIACSVYFMVAPRSTSPGKALCTKSRSLLRWSTVKKMYHKLIHRPIWWGLNWGYVFRNDSSLCRHKTRQPRYNQWRHRCTHVPYLLPCDTVPLEVFANKRHHQMKHLDFRPLCYKPK